MTAIHFHSQQLAQAFDYAAECHAKQTRKGTAIPYLSHLIGVASLVMEAADGEFADQALEDLVIAALLHDAAEDQGGPERLNDIGMRFGERVRSIVDACSDATPEDGEEKPPWALRKQAYLDHVDACVDVGTLVVSAADKLHNARAILTDLRVFVDSGRPQREFWHRFIRNKPGAAYPDRINEILWYYHELAKRFRQAAGPISSPALRRLSLELDSAVDAIKVVGAEDGLAPQPPVSPISPA